MEQTRQLVETITKGIQEKKGQRIVIADLNGIDGSIANYFVSFYDLENLWEDAILTEVPDID